MLVSCTTMNIDMNKNWKIELQSISFVFMSFPIQPRVARKKKKKKNLEIQEEKGEKER